MDDYIKKRAIKYTAKIREIVSGLPDFCDDFFVSIDSNTSVLTRYNYALDLRIFFHYLIENNKYFSNKNIKDIMTSDMNVIQTKDIERFIVYLGCYYTPVTELEKQDELAAKARKYSSVRALFRYLYDNEKIDQNVSTRVRAPKLAEKAIIRLDEEEIEGVYDTMASTHNFSSERKNKYNLNNTQIRDNAIVSLLLGTGIRVSECVGLNLKDFNFDDKTFLVTRKGGKQAILYLNDEIIADLKQYLLFREDRLKHKNIDPISVDAFFLSTQLKRITVRAVEIMVKKYTEVATPLKKITPHKLRSTYGTELYRNTKDIYVVAEVLGHTDINTTKKHYAATSEDIRKDASLKVNFRKGKNNK